MKWKGHVNGKEKEVTGKVEICNLSEEHEDMEDVDLVRMGWPYSKAVQSSLRSYLVVEVVGSNPAVAIVFQSFFIFEVYSYHS